MKCDVSNCVRSFWFFTRSVPILIQTKYQSYDIIVSIEFINSINKEIKKKIKEISYDKKIIRYLFGINLLFLTI